MRNEYNQKKLLPIRWHRGVERSHGKETALACALTDALIDRHTETKAPHYHRMTETFREVYQRNPGSIEWFGCFLSVFLDRLSDRRRKITA